MTDTEGTEARRSDGEETQFIQPIRDYGRAETKPLDLPRATIGGYRADAVERRVAELERRRTLDQAEIIRLKRENHGRQTENGELNQRLTMLREQNKKLEYQASNPYEHIGVDMQNMVNGAKAERKAILDKARAKAETLTAEAKKKADEQIEQAARRKQGIDQEADRRIGESREQAQKLLSDANTEADRILKTAEEKAAGIDAEAKARIADADRREHEAAHTVDQARRLLADAAARLARPMPELPATNPRE